MARWYVIQVTAGSEERTLKTINRAAADGEGACLKECFTPRYRTQIKVRGGWRWVDRSLIPGYLIAVTSRPDKLEEVLRKVSGFARLLRSENGYEPLAAEEVAWFQAFLGRDDHVVGLSSAVKEGDEVIITDGPLREHEARITRIDRRRSTAYVQISFLGRTKEVPVGLKIVTKRT